MGPRSRFRNKSLEIRVSYTLVVGRAAMVVRFVPSFFFPAVVLFALEGRHLN